MGQISIISVVPSDIEALQNISKKTFSETFSSRNSVENMEKFLEVSYNAKKLLLELQNPDSRFYFAKSDDRVIGYLKLNFGNAQTELKDNHAVEIERIYVLQEYHGKNIGKLLYDKAVAIATETEKDYLWLGVWEENFRAIRFYEKNGFEAFDTHLFKVGEDIQTDIMMRKRLS